MERVHSHAPRRTAATSRQRHQGVSDHRHRVNRPASDSTMRVQFAQTCRAKAASYERRRREAKAEMQCAPVTIEAGCLVKQDRKYMRLLAKRYNLIHCDIKAEIDHLSSLLTANGVDRIPLFIYKEYLERHLDGYSVSYEPSPQHHLHPSGS